MFPEPESSSGLLFKSGFLEAYQDTYRVLRGNARSDEQVAYQLGKISGAKAAVEVLSSGVENKG